MASMVAENWEYMDGHDGSENFELSPRNHSLLMSLLDETQIDDCDDERLKNVIRSLEAEIDSTDHYASDNAAWESDLADCLSSVESYSQDSSIKHDELDHHWMDIEIMPTSPSGDMASWCMDQHGQGMMGGGVTEFGWAKNYSPLEAEQDYGSLWHEMNATCMME